MHRKTFYKEERLCSRSSIQDLFHNGSSFVFYPFRIVFSKSTSHTVDPDIPVRVLFSVPKRRFKKASDRNLVKRRLREAFRHHKGGLYDRLSDSDLPSIHLAVQFISSDLVDYQTISSKMEDVLTKVYAEYAKIYLGKNH